MRSADRSFRERLRLLYSECVESGSAPDGAVIVRCRVYGDEAEEFGLVSVDDGDVVDQADFVLGVFPDRGYRELDPLTPGWRRIALGEADSGSVALSGDHILFERRSPWRALVGSVAVSRLIRLQRRHLFFHAASAGIDGRGVLFVGPKGAGKTTLSLALASRGHAFLGDEIAAVRLESCELVPVRRSLAIRNGPRAEPVTEALGRVGALTEVYPDGSERLRAQPAELFPGVSPPALPLRAMVFLRGVADEPRLEPFTPGHEHLRDLTPMGATLWGMPPVQRAFEMLSVLTQVQCYDLFIGDADKTALLVERTMEE